MADEPLSVLSEDVERVEEEAPELEDRVLSELIETLTLMRVLDDRLAELRDRGELGLWVPAGEAAAPAAALASTLRPGDWLYPSFRDAAAYLLRGGSLRHLVAQAIGTASDPQHGRQLAGQPCLDEGRYVPPSASASAGLLRAAGTAVAIRLSGADSVAAAICGPASVEQAGFWMALQSARRHGAPLVVLCRCPEEGGLDPTRRARAVGVEGLRVAGGDLLALVQAGRQARESARDGHPILVEAVMAESVDPVARLRPYLERRGLSDPGRDSELAERARQRVDEAIEVASTEETPAPGRAFEDIAAENPWSVREQRESLLGGGA